MLSVFPLLVLSLVGVVGLAVFFTTIEQPTVSLARLRMFARRHQLTVTVDNGNQVIRYLATTRRWRVIGLAGGLLSSIGWALSQGGVQVDFLTLFAGWFVGALIAEIRLARTSFGPRRAASLTARVPAMYLPRFAWWLVPVTAAISVALAITTAVQVLRGGAAGPTAWLLCGAALLVAVVVSLVQRRVLRRPQPVDAPDLVAADDAVRSRSLHVLTAGGTTLVLYCVLGQLTVLVPLVSGTFPASGAAQATHALSTPGIFLVPIIGWAMATAQWQVVRAAGTDGSP